MTPISPPRSGMTAMSDAATRPATGANAARDQLHATLKACYARTAAAGGVLAKIVQRANTQPDIVGHYAETAHAILALEELKAVCEQAAKDLRTALMASLLETGCPQIVNDDFTVYLAREPAFLEIIDPARVPPDLWTRPKPEPDRKAIKNAIDAGRDVPGASLNVRNSQKLVIRGKSK
jgi:hypothetical protein